MRLNGKTAVITGAATGIGRATAVLFAKECANVVLNTAHNIEEAESTVSEIQLNHGSCTFAMGDVSIEQDVQRIIHKTINQFGQLDVLVNNAAIGVIKPLGETSEEEWDRIQDVNSKGVFLGIRAVLPAMREAGSGSIVNISSISGFVGQEAIHPGYNASKGAVRLLTKAAAVQHAKIGIRVNSVHPGMMPPMLTSFQRGDPNREAMNAAVPMGREGEPIEVANAVLFLASDEASYITGTELLVDGGFTAR